MLTVFIAGLSEGLSFWVDNGHHQILERGDVEQGGVFVVTDVFVIYGMSYVWIDGESYSRCIASTGEQERNCEMTKVCISGLSKLTWICNRIWINSADTSAYFPTYFSREYSSTVYLSNDGRHEGRLQPQSCIVLHVKCSGTCSTHYTVRCRTHLLWVWRPFLVPGLVLNPDEGESLEGEAHQDLGEYGEEQWARDEAGRRPLGHQLLPRWVQAHCTYHTEHTWQEY